MEKDQKSELMDKARMAARHSFAPHSHYPVGAALLAASGAVYLGCNVESSSYGLTVCAERNAVAAGIVAGERQFLAMAIFSPNGATPCGACRQVIWDTCGDIEIYVVDELGRWQVYQLHELLPQPFDENKLKEVQ
jgi:cytidine deaminase